MINKSFTAMILAAGFGTRMLPLTNIVPKPLIEIDGVSLLKNAIDFLFRIGCKKIVINTHYKHKLIKDFINNYDSSNIIISYEKEILDTGGGVKNAIHLFDEDNILVTNSDIFWKKENEKDVLELILNFNSKNECKLLLVEEQNAHGIDNKIGDFSINKNLVHRTQNQNINLYYSGMQMINLNILKKYNKKKFSFNEIWDFQIKKQRLFGILMKTDLYHVGNIKDLQKAIESNT